MNNEDNLTCPNIHFSKNAEQNLQTRKTRKLSEIAFRPTLVLKVAEKHVIVDRSCCNDDGGDDDGDALIMIVMMNDGDDQLCPDDYRDH